MWLWARELGVSPQAALVAAPAWALSLAMTPWLLFPQTGVLSLWPWLLFLAERARETVFATRCAAALTVLFAVMVLAGHPESLALGCVFCAGWLLLRAALGRDRRCLTALARVAACGAVAALLVAWLLLPTLAALAASNRLAGLSALPWARFLSLAPHAPAWPAGPLQLLFPFTYGDGIASPMLPGSPSAFSEIASGYSGLAAAVLALLVLRRGPRRRESVALLLLAAAGVLVAVGQWPFLEAASRIPLIRFMVPLRFLTWAALAVPVLAALELDRYARDAAVRRQALARARRGGARRRRRRRGDVRLPSRGARPGRRARLPAPRARGGVRGRARPGGGGPAPAAPDGGALCRGGRARRRRAARRRAPPLPRGAVGRALSGDAARRLPAVPDGRLPDGGRGARALPEHERVRADAGRPHARSARAPRVPRVPRRELRVSARRVLPHAAAAGLRRPGLPECALPGRAGRRDGTGREVDLRVLRVRRNRLRERRGAPARLRSAPRPLRPGGRRSSRRAKSRLERRGRPDRGGSARAGRRTRACAWTPTTSPSIA